jgi:hypothetical protein
MINPVILSETNADDALSVFNLHLNDMYTLLIVTGTHPEAKAALAAANEMLNSGQLGFASVRLIHAPIPGFIVQVLKQLKCSQNMDMIDWSMLSHYAIFSISNKHNNIGDALKNKDTGINLKGKINLLLLNAEAADVPLV